MGRVVWTEPALDDLRAIVDSIARTAPATAVKLGDRIVKAPRRLRRAPHSGSRVPEFDRDDIREVLVGPYRIIYAIRDRTCRILTVVHGGRQLGNRLKAEDLDNPR
jgi:plasmid stabilization system protein ParE